WEVFRRFAKSRTEEPQRNNCPQTKASRAYVGTGTGSGFDVLSRESGCLVHPRMPGFDPRRVLIIFFSVSAAQSMSASLRKRPKCCTAANRREVPILFSNSGFRCQALRDHP